MDNNVFDFTFVATTHDDFILRFEGQVQAHPSLNVCAVSVTGVWLDDRPARHLFDLFSAEVKHTISVDIAKAALAELKSRQPDQQQSAAPIVINHPTRLQ